MCKQSLLYLYNRIFFSNNETKVDSLKCWDIIIYLTSVYILNSSGLVSD